MKLKAKVDILAEGKKFKAGSEFTVSKETGLLLIRFGWAEELPEEVKAPKKVAKSKK